MFKRKKKNKKEKTAMQDYVKWSGQWNKREERKREIETDTKNIKKVEGLTEEDIENLSYDFVRVFLSMDYKLERFPEENYGGEFKGERLIKKFNSLDRLLIFINYFPKQAISKAINMLTREQRVKIKKRLNIPPPMSNEEKAAVWNAFIQKYYFDEIDRIRMEKEKKGWVSKLFSKLKGK